VKIENNDERFVATIKTKFLSIIRKVFEVDPLICPQCGGEMKVISFIEDHKVIDKIIAHLKLIIFAERPPPPKALQQELLMASEEMGEYF